LCQPRLIGMAKGQQHQRMRGGKIARQRKAGSSKRPHGKWRQIPGPTGGYSQHKTRRQGQAPNNEPPSPHSHRPPIRGDRLIERAPCDQTPPCPASPSRGARHQAFVFRSGGSPLP
jgi:hypothetical protein